MVDPGWPPSTAPSAHVFLPQPKLGEQESISITTNTRSTTNSSRKARGTACMRCRMHRVQCSGSFPWPQAPTPYKGFDNDGEGDMLKEAQGSGKSKGGAEKITVRKRRRGGDQRKKQEVDAALAIAARLEADQALMLELIFDRLEPRPLVGIFLETVTETVSRCQIQEDVQQIVDRSWTVSVLRKWWLHSSLAGADTSWGMGKTVAQLLDITLFDLEDAETVSLDFPPQTVSTRRQAVQAKLMAGMLEMKQHAAFQDLLAQLSPTAAVYAKGTTADGLTVDVCNEAFGVLFRRAESLFISDVVLYKTLPHILFLGLVAPDDRREWSRFIVEANMKAPLEPAGGWRRTRIFKLVGAEGNIQLFLVEARPLPGLGAGGMAIILEPCPPSRHLTHQPGTTRRAARKTREVVAANFLSKSSIARLDHALSGRSGGGGDRGEARGVGHWGVQGEKEGSGIVLPGMAVLPIAPPPYMHSLMKQPPAAEKEALEVTFGPQISSPIRLSSSASGKCGDDNNQGGKMLPMMGRTERGHSLEFNLPSLELAEKASVLPALAYLSSSMTSSTSTLLRPSVCSLSSSSSSSLSFSSSSLSLSSVLRQEPLHQLPRHQLQQPFRTHVPAYGGPASPGVGLSGWECPPPVLDADLLESVFGEGEHMV